MTSFRALCAGVLSGTSENKPKYALFSRSKIFKNSGQGTVAHPQAPHAMEREHPIPHALPPYALGACGSTILRHLRRSTCYLLDPDHGSAHIYTQPLGSTQPFIPPGVGKSGIAYLDDARQAHSLVSGGR